MVVDGTFPRLDGGCGSRFDGAPCALNPLPGQTTAKACCNHDLGECGSGEDFCKCDSCVDHSCIKNFVTSAIERLDAEDYVETVEGTTMKILDQMKVWVHENMEENPKAQKLMERAAWLESELTDFLFSARCRNSRELMQPVPADITSQVNALSEPDRFWDGYDPVIDFYLSNCGEKKIDILKHKMEKLKTMMQKACNGFDCKSLFDETSAKSSTISALERSSSYFSHAVEVIKRNIQTLFRRMKDGTYQSFKVYY